LTELTDVELSFQEDSWSKFKSVASFFLTRQKISILLFVFNNQQILLKILTPDVPRTILFFKNSKRKHKYVKEGLMQ